MTFTKIAAASALALLMAAPALAQPPRMTPEERAAAFDKADANHDGKLTFAEWKSSIPAEMASQASDEQLQGFFARRDADGDKALTKAEFTAPMQRPQ
ncbi:MAG: EF-hand domain-containing protein [Hyphomonadaceae bacterium]